MLTLRLFVLRLSATIVSYFAERAVRASYALGQKLIARRHEYIRGTATPKSERPVRFEVRGNVVYMTHPDGRTTYWKGQRGQS